MIEWSGVNVPPPLSSTVYEPMTLTVHELFRSPLIACAESRCSAPPDGWGAERCDDITTLLLTRTGVYARRARGRDTIADAGMALLYRAAEPYRIGHPAARGAGDRCTILRPGDALLDALFGATPCADTAARLGPGAQLLHAAALARWRAPAERDDLAGEEAALALLERARRDFGPTGAEGASPAARRVVARVQARLAAAPEADVGLTDLAGEAGVSPFHLCRLFRRETGLTIQRYRLRLRLATALERLAEGEANLARLALDLGFSHHSHLTAAFRRHFGAPPGVVRERLRAARLRRLGTFLTAPPTAPR
jgi:AraC family transcriptional regulator